MKRCSIAPTSCAHRAAAPCCHKCGEQRCKTRCRNHPDRCKCWVDKPPKRGRPKGRKVDTLQVIELHDCGLNMMEIAKQVGCHRHTVSQILHEREGIQHA